MGRSCEGEFLMGIFPYWINDIGYLLCQYYHFLLVSIILSNSMNQLSISSFILSVSWGISLNGFETHVCVVSFRGQLCNMFIECLQGGTRFLKFVLIIAHSCYLYGSKCKRFCVNMCCR